jgi:hypothetical protein
MRAQGLRVREYQIEPGGAARPGHSRFASSERSQPED